MVATTDESARRVPILVITYYVYVRITQKCHLRSGKRHRQVERMDSSKQATGQSSPPESSQPLQWACPGVSVRKRWLTGLGVALAALVFLFIGFAEGAMVVSTIIGIIFIACFIWYLRIVAPVPFTLTLDAESITRQDQGSSPTTIPWDRLAKVKQEVFKNGTAVSLTVYKRVGERGLHRAWVVYRDDIPRFDELVQSMRAALPEETPWIVEQVHE